MKAPEFKITFRFAGPKGFKPYYKYMLLEMWKNGFGWKRFFYPDYWRAWL